MIKTQTLKGFRDFLPSEARKRQYVINTLKGVFESYGFEPLETPALEYEEILLGKYGDQGDKLMYRFEDNGKRKVALRYDQTVPLARVVAQFQNELPMPFKRYQIQPVWRGDNTQKGRYREFLQCDIDTVGSPSLLADAEIISCALVCAKKLGFKKAKMFINDRSLFKDLKPELIAIIDKLGKIGKDGVIDELTKKGITKEKAISLMDSLENKTPTPNLLTIFQFLKDMSLSENIDFVFKPTLARGLDYYTGTIFELISEDYNNGTLAGGGRYDNLIGMFTNKQIPAVGIAFGFDRTIDAMNDLNLFPKDLATTKVLVTIFSSDLKQQSFNCSMLLRSSGVQTELYLDENAKMEKQLKYADQKGIPYVVIIGPDEASKDMVTLRNMKTRDQKTVSANKLSSFIL